MEDSKRSVADQLNDLLGDTDAEENSVVEAVLEVDTAQLEATQWEPRDCDPTKQMRLELFSVLFGWKPTCVPDFLVPIFKGYDSAKPIDLYVPSRDEFEWVAYCLSKGIKALMTGPTGSGKTLMMEHFAACTGRPCLRIDHTIELDKAQVFGSVHINDDGTTGFVKGDLPQSCFYPYIVILDELSRSSGASNLIYKRVLDRNVVYLPEMKETGEKEIVPDPYWVMCATDNTLGDGEDLDKYPMSNVQDAAFRNAWGAHVELDYLPQSSERALISAWSPEMDGDSVSKLALFSSAIHDGFKNGTINTAFSPRQLKNICTMFNDGISLSKALHMSYISFTSKSERSDVIETKRAVFGA